MKHLGSWLAGAVDHLKNNWQAHIPPGLVFVVATMVMALGFTAVMVVLGGVVGFLAAVVQDERVVLIAAIIGGIAFFAAIIVMTVLIQPLWMAYVRYTIHLLRGEKPELGELAWGYKHIAPVTGLIALTMAATFIAMLFCYFPGFLVAAALYFAMPVMADRECGPIEAIKASWELVKANFLDVFVLMLVVMVGSMVLSYVPFIGPMAMIIVFVVIQSVAYVQLTSGGEGSAAPPAGQ